MTITITAFERSPDGGQGLARDTRVRIQACSQTLHRHVRVS